MSDRRAVRSRLRALVQEMSGDHCEWPGCIKAGEELAHLHSIGMGGRPSADSLCNVAWMCHTHALASDGVQQDWPSFKQAHDRLWGTGWEERLPMNQWAYERAEALVEHVAGRRRRAGFDPEAL